VRDAAEPSRDSSFRTGANRIETVISRPVRRSKNDYCPPGFCFFGVFGGEFDLLAAATALGSRRSSLKTEGLNLSQSIKERRERDPHEPAVCGYDGVRRQRDALVDKADDGRKTNSSRE
jgi:hypothetical protein